MHLYQPLTNFPLLPSPPMLYLHDQRVRKMEMERHEDGVVLMGRAEIDTRAPFRSVKEAVMLFGERVLTGEIYANKLNEMRAAEALMKEQSAPCMGSLMTELEETRQDLEREREESLVMSNTLNYLKEQLEKTTMELDELKYRGTEIEDLKFVEDTTDVEMEEPVVNQGTEFQSKRSVKFASLPSLAQAISKEEQVLGRQFSMNKETESMKKKKKKKPLIHLIGAIFPKRKDHQDCAPTEPCSI